MAVIQDPTTAASLAGVDNLYKSQRVSPRPAEGGHFMLGAESGALAGVAAGGSVLSIRNGDATKLVVIEKLMLRFFITTVFTAAQELGLDLFRASGWSAADSGGTALTAIPKRRSAASTPNAFASSLFAAGSPTGQINIATTAALTAGTRTIDANPVYRKSITAQNTANALIIDEILNLTQDIEEGLVLAQNEGLILSPKVTLGAAGVMRLQTFIKWREIV